MSIPGDIRTVPSDALYFNAPFDEFLIARLIITNIGNRLINFRLKSTLDKERIGVATDSLQLRPFETKILLVTIKPYDGPIDVEEDRVTIEWTDSPVNAPKKQSRGWITGDAIVKRKEIAIRFNE